MQTSSMPSYTTPPLNFNYLKMKISPTLVVLWAFCFQLSLGFVRSQCLEDQRSSLIQFKGNLTFDSTLSTSLVTWNSSTDCCLWEGVMCNDGGHVIGLDLNSESIFGGIDNSSSLFDLHHIQSLDLANNNFSGPIPSFSSAKNLTELRLFSNLFSGSITNTNWSGLSKLEYIDLSGNSLHGVIPASLFGIPSLQSIHLYQNQFTGIHPEFTGIHPESLRSLFLASNNFSGPIPSFSSAKNLTELDLGSNHFSGSIINTNWSALSKLEFIDLYNNSLHGVIPASLFGIPYLRRIDLSQNQFTGLNEPSKLASSINLLDLSNNKLAGPFPMFVSQLRSLESLWLGFNNFSGQVNLCSLQQLMNLSRLDLSYNSLSIYDTGVDPTSFPQIYELILTACNLTRIPAFLKEKSHIQVLDLSNNKIGGDIPNWIWPLPLFYLNLSHNSLLNFQESSEGFNYSMSFLDLSNNKLQGELLTKIPYVSSALYLSNNKIQGSIPRSICAPMDLAILDLSNNSLNGSIPQCLFGTGSLQVLNLRGNNLSGNISDTFSGNCDSLLTLDLNRNQLEGKIPKSLADCKSLVVLDIGNNQINDVFPCHLKNISSLRVLVLRSNSFHGPIGCPNNNSSWTMLQIVDLAYNNFKGEVPNQFLRSWKAMIFGKDELQSIRVNAFDAFLFYDQPYDSLNYQDAITIIMKGTEIKMAKILTMFTSIDFSCNKLEGRIPDVIGEFKALHILNMSHNSLTGQIPTSFGNLLQLESVDLSSNHLIGKIPQEMANLNFLAVLNLSNNQLVGRIPTSNQFQTFSNDSYQGNDELCGFPLTKDCGVEKKSCDVHSEESCRVDHIDDGSHINWNILSVELGLVFGLGIVILPLMFWTRWRIWYYTHVDILLSRLLPRLNQRSGTSKRTRAKTTLRERMAGEVALQPQVPNVRRGRRIDGVIVV